MWVSSRKLLGLEQTSLVINKGKLRMSEHGYMHHITLTSI